jgi:hypothetical protein
MVVGGLSDAAASILPLACDLLAGGLAGAGAVPIGVGCIASVPAGGIVVGGTFSLVGAIFSLPVRVLRSI